MSAYLRASFRTRSPESMGKRKASKSLRAYGVFLLSFLLDLTISLVDALATMFACYTNLFPVIPTTLKFEAARKRYIKPNQGKRKMAKEEYPASQIDQDSTRHIEIPTRQDVRNLEN